MPKKAIYHYLPTTGVRADFKRLMNDFISAKTVRYEYFSEIWRRRKFSFLCAGRHSEREAREFVERALLIALDFFLPPYQFQVRVGGLYLLYGIFMTQPVVPKVKVRLTASQWQDTMIFHHEASQQNHLDVVFVFNKMQVENAFQFCYTPAEMNERTLNPEKDDDVVNLADEMKEERREINRLFNYESMEQLSYLLDHYCQMKVNLAGPKATQPDKSLDVVQGTLVEDLVGMLQSFKEVVGNVYKHGMPQGASEPSQEAGTSKPVIEQSILSRRLALRAKGYSGLGEKSPKKTTTFDSSLDKKGENEPGPSQIKTQPGKVSRPVDGSEEEEDSLETFVSPSNSMKKRGRPRKTQPESVSKQMDGSEEEDLLETFLSPSKSVKKRGRPRKTQPESVSRPEGCPRKTISQQTAAVGREGICSKIYGSRVSPRSSGSSRSNTELSHSKTRQGDHVEIEYVDSVKVCSKRGGELASKLEEIVKGSSNEPHNPWVSRKRKVIKNATIVRKSSTQGKSLAKQPLDSNGGIQTEPGSSGANRPLRKNNENKATARKVSRHSQDTHSESELSEDIVGDSEGEEVQSQRLRKKPADRKRMSLCKQPELKSPPKSISSKTLSQNSQSESVAGREKNVKELRIASKVDSNKIVQSTTKTLTNATVSQALRKDSESPSSASGNRLSRQPTKGQEFAGKNKPVGNVREEWQDEVLEASPPELAVSQRSQNAYRKNPQILIDDSPPPQDNKKQSKSSESKGASEAPVVREAISTQSPRKLMTKIARDGSQEQTYTVSVVGRKRLQTNSPDESLLEDDSSEENTSPVVKKSRPANETTRGFGTIFKRESSLSRNSACESTPSTTGFSSKGSVFKTSKAPLAKVIGGKADSHPTSGQVKKPVKIIKIVTKGKSEAQAILKSLEMQKASGKKLLENLPSHCVQMIRVGTDSSLLRGSRGDKSGSSFLSGSSGKPNAKDDGPSKVDSDSVQVQKKAAWKDARFL